MELSYSYPIKIQEIKGFNNFILDVGLDEAGRGSLIGRVYTAAYCLPKIISEKEILILQDVRDSKRISEKKRFELFEKLKEISYCYAIDYAEIKEIEQYNILQATMRSFHRCLDGLQKYFLDNETILSVDGNYFVPYNDLKYNCIKQGDNTYINIACASILAKCSRDLYIYQICQEHAEEALLYYWKSNKGYPEKKHIKSILDNRRFSNFHRKNFQPIKKLIEDLNSKKENYDENV